MGSLIRNISDFYKYLNDDLSDPRTKNFVFCSSPALILTIVCVYYKFVTSWGPAFMANRPAYNLKKCLIIYNIIQVYLAIYMSYQTLTKLYLSGYYSVWCQKISYESNEIENEVLYMMWLYYMVKIVDLMDTVFFVLRKKSAQVSFLHIYHHIGMCLLSYVGNKYVPGGHGVMIGLINSVVHAVMYSYYLISIVRPEWVRPWWKKHITQIQIFQFLLLILHFSHVLFDSCEYPKWAVLAFLPQNIFMLVLFLDFYTKEYIYKKRK